MYKTLDNQLPDVQYFSSRDLKKKKIKEREKDEVCICTQIKIKRDQ